MLPVHTELGVVKLTNQKWHTQQKIYCVQSVSVYHDTIIRDTMVSWYTETRRT